MGCKKRQKKRSPKTTRKGKNTPSFMGDEAARARVD
jgi:hypothetical protein